MENNKNKKSVKFQGDMLNFCDFIQVFVFLRNHHLKAMKSLRTLRTAEHEEDLASDNVSDDVSVIRVPAHRNGCLRNRINYYLTQTGIHTDGQFSAEILKIPGQNLRLHCKLGSIAGEIF